MLAAITNHESHTMRKFLILTASALMLTACQPTATNSTEKPAISAEQLAENNAAINTWLDAKYDESVMRSPMWQTYMGIRGEDYGKWDIVTEARAAEDLQIAKDTLAELRSTFDPKTLGENEAVSYLLMEASLEEEIEAYKWRHHGYPFNQMFGAHSGTPAFLINQHVITNEAEARAYISRIKGVPAYMDQIVAASDRNVAAGVQPPKFVYDLLLDDIGNLTKGAPFERGEPSALFADFSKKVNALPDLSAAEKKDLRIDAANALKTAFKPAYIKLEKALRAQSETAGTDDGVWRLPDGEAYYKYRLKSITTTDMTATQIHDLGLSEVARIHDEMRAIMKSVGFEGNLQDFFAYMRDDPDGKFHYPDTEEGRAAYLSEATALIETMKGDLDDVFIKKPKADLIVKAVEPFREKTAGKAFYSRPAPDGSRPGIYYANLYSMKDMPIYQMEALAYHEGIPGHHMQLAISQELTGIPKFRKFGGYTAYTEGWGLYSEFLPKEMGYYTDPYSDFGRLAMELWRAARLVVDTGLHDKKWTREEAIKYLVDNTPNAENDCRKAIERYIVMPGQATAYKIGMIKILELREDAKAKLGDKFDIREFHDVVLAVGPVPLGVLETRVNNWVASKA